jgi:hypothetical protein
MLFTSSQDSEPRRGLRPCNGRVGNQGVATNDIGELVVRQAGDLDVLELDLLHAVHLPSLGETV